MAKKIDITLTAIAAIFVTVLSVWIFAEGQSTSQPSPAATQAAGDWPEFRGLNRDGKSAETGLLDRWPEGGPRLLWTADGIGKGFSHVCVVGGIVYVTGELEKEGILSAFTTDGRLKWRIKYGPEYDGTHPGARTIPTIRDGMIYIMSAMGTLYCFNAAEGKKVWSVDVFEKYEARNTMWGFAESVFVDGDRVIVTPCGKKATMVALDRKSGAEIWASQPLGQESGYCSPLPVSRGGKKLIVTMTKEAVVAFAAEDGKLVWQHQYKNFRGNHPDTPIYDDGFFYVTSGYGKGAIGLQLAEDGGSVKQTWEQSKQDPVHGQAVLVDGFVYASSHQSAGGQWSCVNFKTGKLAWLADCVGKGGSVIYAGGMLYCYSEDGVVGLVRPTSDKCDVVSSFKVAQGDGSHWAHPVVAGGKLYIRHGNVLMCHDVSAAGGKQ